MTELEKLKAKHALFRDADGNPMSVSKAASFLAYPSLATANRTEQKERLARIKLNLTMLEKAAKNRMEAGSQRQYSMQRYLQELRTLVAQLEHQWK